jgi:hypothetical protein
MHTGGSLKKAYIVRFFGSFFSDVPFEIVHICTHYILPSMKYALDTGSGETEDLAHCL